MNARDDWPGREDVQVRFSVVLWVEQYDQMCDEIDRLRAEDAQLRHALTWPPERPGEQVHHIIRGGL